MIYHLALSLEVPSDYQGPRGTAQNDKSLKSFISINHDSCFQVWWRKKRDVAQYLIWKKNIDVRIVHVVSSLLLLSMPFQSQLLNFVDGSMTSLLTFTEHKKLDCKFQTVNLSNSKREQITSFKIILVSSTFFLVIDATCLRTPMPLKANMPILTP